MSKVLQNFLIGVGLDTEKYDKGAKNVEGSLGRMRTLVGFTGAAMAGAFGLAGTAAINAGKRVHDFNNAAEKLKTPTQYVHDYGRALAALGGNAEEALAAISAIEKAQSDLKLAGMLGPLENVALARGDINALSQTQDGGEFLRTLAGMVPQMDKDQRRMVQDALGLSDVVMISLQNGVEAFDAGIVRAGELYGEFGRTTDEAREFVRALAEINTQIGSISESLAEKMLPAFTGVLQSTSDFIQKNRAGIDEAIGAAVESPASTAAVASGVALAAPWAWRAARAVGLRSIPYAGLVYGAYEGLRDEPVGDWWNQSVDSARDSWRGITGQGDYSHLPDVPYGPAVPDVAPGGAIPRDPNASYMPLNQHNVSPIYAGGEVSNAEAASASPDVIMVKDQRQQADRPATTPRINVQNHLEVQMEIEGRALDSRVVDVIERRERDAAEDIYSSVDR